MEQEYNLKLVSVNGKDATIEVTYPDTTKKTMTVSGLNTQAEVAADFVSSAKEYMKAYLSGEAQAKAQPTASAAVTALVGKSAKITI